MPSRHLLSSGRSITLLGVFILNLISAGCRPTSESAGISALSMKLVDAPTSTVEDPEPLAEMESTPVISNSEAPVLPPTMVPTPTPTTCRESKGVIKREAVPSSHLREPLVYRLYLPPCFSQDQSESYPLLVLLHGSIFTDDQWDRLGIDETADRLIDSGKIKPLIIVMPFEEQTLTSPYQAGFGTAIATELLPWLESNYPLCRERSCRAVGGISRGASWAVHIGFTDWQLFGSIGGHSLPPFWGDLNSLPLWLADIPQDERPRVFMDVGQGDPYRAPASQFEQFLTVHNIPHEWYLFNGGHDETYWSSHIEQYLLWYSAAWNDR